MRILMRSVVIVFVLAGTISAIGQTAEGAVQGSYPQNIVDVGNRKQLFIDDRFFSQQYGIKLVVNPPAKAEMVLLPEKPWEKAVLGYYSTIIEDEGIYKLWYDAFVGGDVSKNFPRSLCYATSKDGIHWQRENVNLFNWMGHEENNIVMPGTCGSVMIDPKAPKEERYKALCIIHTSASESPLWPEAKGAYWDITGGGIYLLTSPDGIHWKLVSPVASPIFHDSQNFMLWDDRTQKYIAYMRTHEKGRTLGTVVLEDPMETPWPFRPMPAHVKPNQYGLYMGSNFGNYDIAMSCDEMDPPDTDVQICPVVKYPWAQDVFLGLMTLYHHFPETVPGKFLNDGIQDVQLVVSRDGLNWERPDRRPYIPLGPMGSWDGGNIWPSLGIIRSGNEIWQYYCATSFTHGKHDAKTFHKGGLCRLVQRLDGFVSADADYTGGEFTTPLLKFSGTKLELNLDCSALGNVCVEILDEGNKPIDGYSLEDAVAIDRNHIAVPVIWTSGKDVGALQNRDVRLRFKLRACKLYGFQFVDK